MTAIQGFIPASRRPGELGIHSLDRFLFSVPDLAVAQRFYSEFGLDIQTSGSVLTMGTYDHPHVWGTISEGPRKKFGYCSFGAFEDDIDRLRQPACRNMKIKRRDSHRASNLTVFGLTITDGDLIEVKSSGKVFAGRERRGSFPGGRRRANAAPRSAARCRERVRGGQPTSCRSRAITQGDGILYPRPGIKGVRTIAGENGRVSTRHSRQRSSHDGVRALGRARAASSAVGTSDRSTRSAWAPCTCSRRATPKAGDSAATFSARTISTTCAIRGAATAEYSADIDYVPATVTGRAAISRRKTRFTLGDQMSRKISFGTMRPIDAALIATFLRTTSEAYLIFLNQAFNGG